MLAINQLFKEFKALPSIKMTCFVNWIVYIPPLILDKTNVTLIYMALENLKFHKDPFQVIKFNVRASGKLILLTTQSYIDYVSPSDLFCDLINTVE